MYIPNSFLETDLTKLHDFMEQHSFAILVSLCGEQPWASHLPLILDRHCGPHGALMGHVARANPQWRSLSQQQCLTIFSGPHAYISPTWYEAQAVVPTWNYVAVHAYGVCEVIEDRESLLEILRRSIAIYEKGSSSPWEMGEVDDYLSGQLKAIVGLRISLDRIEGKWKLSQNQSQERQMRVIQALKQTGNKKAMEIAGLMRGYLDGFKGSNGPSSP